MKKSIQLTRDEFNAVVGNAWFQGSVNQTPDLIEWLDDMNAEQDKAWEECLKLYGIDERDTED